MNKDKKNKLHNLNVGNKNWYIFYVVGLKILDQDDWQDFIFSDATIINGSQLSYYLKSQNINVDSLWKVPNNLESELTFILIEKTGIIEKSDENRIFEKAQQRAYEVIGFLYYIILYLSNYRIGICLDSQTINSNSWQSIVFYGTRKLTEFRQNTSGEYYIMVPENDLIYSRNELIEIFNKDIFKFIFKSVKRGDNVITESLMYFYITSNIPSAIMQLLGSITSTEILLKLDDASYKSISKRIESFGSILIKSLIKDNSQFQSVFTVRNNVIHQGKQCNKYDAFRAIRLYSEILIDFSYFFNVLQSKESVCKILDQYYNFQNDFHLKNINKGFLKEFKKLLNHILKRDWIIPKLIEYNGLCNLNNKQETLKTFCIVCLWYSLLRNMNYEKTYTEIYNYIYYNLTNMPNYEEFILYFNENYNEINDSVTSSMKVLKFDLTIV